MKQDMIVILDNQRPPANVMQWVKQNIPDK